MRPARKRKPPLVDLDNFWLSLPHGRQSQQLLSSCTWLEFETMYKLTYLLIIIRRFSTDTSVTVTISEIWR